MPPLGGRGRIHHSVEEENQVRKKGWEKRREKGMEKGIGKDRNEGRVGKECWKGKEGKREEQGMGRV